jgi:hypothetical protein
MVRNMALTRASNVRFLLHCFDDFLCSRHLGFLTKSSDVCWIIQPSVRIVNIDHNILIQLLH